MAEYAQWAIGDLVPFGVYVIGMELMLVVVAVVGYMALYIGWICHMFLTAKGNLLADKLEAKEQAKFEQWYAKLLYESEKDNG